MKRILIGALLMLSVTANAWDDTGHRIIARVAWDTLGKTPSGLSARDRFMDVLIAGDEQYRPIDRQDAEAFADAANFCDFIKRADMTGPSIDLADKFNDSSYPVSTPDRDKDGENTRCKSWHYFDTPLNLAPGTKPFERPSNGINAMADVVKNASTADPLEKAWWAYWLLHLTGDLHQPLHCVSDFTDAIDPKTGLVTGDNGGNRFNLNGRRNLHSYWDQALTRATATGKRYRLAVSRRAAELEAEYPIGSYGADVDNLDPKAWVAEGAEVAKASVYQGITAGTDPSADYSTQTNIVAKKRGALAGYRLARLIEKLYK